MAFLKHMLRSVVFLFVASNLVRTESKEEKYEDLIYTSMQSIAVQNDVITNLAAKVAQMMISFSELTISIQKTKESLNLLEQKVVNLEVEKVSKDDFASLTSSLGETNARIGAVEEKTDKGEVVIVSGEQAPGDEKCMKVCAGSTGRDTTDWYDSGSDTVYYDVDISDCDFITIPTVTTALEGIGGHVGSFGTGSVYNTSPASFRIYLRHVTSDPSGGHAESLNWNVEWIAVGYTC